MIQKKSNFYSSDWIKKLETPYSWDLYWHQLDLIINQSGLDIGSKVNEIGIGNGLASGYLRKLGFEVTTIDIDKDKKPDIVADITAFEFPKADLYAAFEVFEHIPIEKARDVWAKLAKKGIRQIAISLPYAYRTYLRLDMWSPFFGDKSFQIGRKRNYIHSKHHFWELGYNGNTVKSIIDDMASIGYISKLNYRFRSHHFFLFILDS